MTLRSLLLALAACLALGAREPVTGLVQSVPAGTDLADPALPFAREVWVDMVRGAKASVEAAEFYVTSRPGSALEPVLAELEKAGARGVKVRFLLSAKMLDQDPASVARIRRIPGAEVRSFDLTGLSRGILHAKYFLVDGREAFLGSQNFDWRSLEHIQELGVRVRMPETVARLRSVFELDWAHAGGAPVKTPTAAVRPFGEPESASNGALKVITVASPADQLPDHVEWDLPRLVELIDGARERVRIQLLTYKMTTRDKSYWEELESALRRAAARGVRVQLLLADWCKRRGTIEGLQALEPLENVEVKLVTIPQASSGFVPYARVVHAKFLVADGADAWLGTSNWERDYFYAGRNVGLVVHGASFASQLARFFDDGWSSSYASALDACARYEAPRIGD